MNAFRPVATVVVIAGLIFAACGGPATGSPPPGTGSGTPTGGTPTGGLPTSGAGGDLPDSGALVRVVNVFADEAGPQTLDIYGFGGTEIVSHQVLVATVAYGTASDWFNPGFVEGSAGARTAGVAVHLEGSADQLIGARDTSIVAGSRATVIVGPSDNLGPRIGFRLDSHPDTGHGGVPQALADSGVLVTSHAGMPPEFAGSAFYASIGNYCLRGRFPNPDIEEIVGHPLGQPIGSDLVVEPGSHTLTIHRGSEDPQQPTTCQDGPLAQAALEIATGGRAYVFIYAEPGEPDAEPGEADLSVLVVPFDD